MYDIKIFSVGYDDKQKVIVDACCVSEELVKILIDKYGHSGNKIDIENTECCCLCCEEE